MYYKITIGLAFLAVLFCGAFCRYAWGKIKEDNKRLKEAKKQLQEIKSELKRNDS